MHDGKLYLSLNDAIALALENNLDIAIARYNLNIADTDVLRAKAGAQILGVPLGIVQNTPGGGVGGIGTQVGSGTGGTNLGAGGAGVGVGGIVGSTLVDFSDPLITSFDPDRHGYTARTITPISFQPARLRERCNAPAPRTSQYTQGFQWGTNSPVGLQQHPDNHEQRVPDGQPGSQLRLPVQADTASASRLWIRGQQPLHPHCEKQSGTFRCSLPAANHHHRQPDREYVLGSGLRL